MRLLIILTSLVLVAGAPGGKDSSPSGGNGSPVGENGNGFSSSVETVSLYGRYSKALCLTGDVLNLISMLRTYKFECHYHLDTGLGKLENICTWPELELPQLQDVWDLGDLKCLDGSTPPKSL